MTSETFRSPRLGIAVFLTIAAAAAISPGYEKIEDVPKNFKMPAPLPLKESVASIEVSPGLRVELIAAEPLVMDPIAIDWGPDGRLWPPIFPVGASPSFQRPFAESCFHLRLRLIDSFAIRARRRLSPETPSSANPSTISFTANWRHGATFRSHCALDEADRGVLLLH
ncbi:MAG: hypothetical protein H7A53_11940 [Akkermansiaceae bacterium]|nr:hypothetical protein [Akkermansiaceae bacterium]